MRTVINGKMTDLQEGSTVADVRQQLGAAVGGDQFLVEDPTVGSKLLAEQDRLTAGKRYFTIPQIVKG